MLETITVDKFYSNREVAEKLGIQPATVRQIKSRKAEELDGLWRNDNDDGETAWTQEGLDKIAEFVQTDEAKQYCAGKLARRTQETIAVDRANLYQNENQVSTRTGTETSTYSISEGRYSQLPEQLGDMVSDRMVKSGDAIGRMDRQVAMNLLKAANLSDMGIDLEALLG